MVAGARGPAPRRSNSDGDGDPLDGLRALCAAAWAAAGDGRCRLDPAKALDRLAL